MRGDPRVPCTRCGHADWCHDPGSGCAYGCPVCSKYRPTRPWWVGMWKRPIFAFRDWRKHTSKFWRGANPND